LRKSGAGKTPRAPENAKSNTIIMPGKKTQTAISQTKPNYVYTIISVALVLFLLGLFALLVVHGQQFIRFAKEQVEVIVELKNTADGSDIGRLKEKLARSPGVKPGSVRFIGKEEGAKLLAAELGEEFMKLNLANPLYDVVVFHLKADYMSGPFLEKMRADLRGFDFVSDVFYQESLVDAIARNISKLTWITLGIGLFFVLVAVTLIHNTIRLALYANRFLIKNMELVGASWEFISYPYIWKSVRYGMISAVLAILGLSGFLFWIKEALPNIENILFVPGILVIFSALVLIGIFINALSTYYVVNKYLRMRLDDLY